MRAGTAEASPGVLIAVKALIMLTTLTALAVPAMHEFRGEAMTGRVLVYAVAVLLIPAGWLVCGRRSYPVAADSAHIKTPSGISRWTCLARRSPRPRSSYSLSGRVKL
jgi:hypothetical protein